MSIFPEFFTVNDRPVKLVMHKTGGFDVLALDMKTGDWEPAYPYYERYLQRDGDIDLLTESEFKALVSSIRKRLGVPEFD